jgi:hypothetical protein
VSSSARSALFFARCDSCAGGVSCWADAVVGCGGVGGMGGPHRAVAERALRGHWVWGP